MGYQMEYYQGEQLSHVGDVPAMGAHRYGAKPAFHFHGQQLTFDQLDTQADEIANVLVDNGVEAGDRVGLFIPNTMQFPPAFYGVVRAGAVATPLNLRMDPETLGFVVHDAGIDHLIASPFLADEAQELAAAAGVGTLYLPGVSEEGVVNLSHATMEADGEFDRTAHGRDRAYDDVAVQLYTSGTTGKPKGVPQTHENVLTTMEGYSSGPLPLDPEDSILLVLPLFHVYALNAIMGVYLAAGGEMVLQPEPVAEDMLSAIDDHGINDFAGVPAMYTMMFREYREDPDAYDLSSLEDVICAAAPLADDTRKRIEKAWNVNMIEGWGMTETSPAGTLEPTRGVSKEAGCIGLPLPKIEMQLVDPETRETVVAAEDLEPAGMIDSDHDFGDEDSVTGEIAIRGPQVCDGYYERPDATAKAFDDDGWFYTKDIARVDGDGYFWLIDRADDMIITGGENVYPAEVEDALYAHEDVAEAGVTAAEHELKGEAPVAFVVPEEDAAPSEEAIRRFTLDHVASYAHPRRVFFVDELPRSATQKVQRYQLGDMLDERLDGPLTSEGEEL